MLAGSVQAAAPDILVADDEPMLLQLVSRILARSGLRAVTAADGEEALSAVDRYAGSLRAVLVDQALPPAGAVEALRRIHERAPRLGVVVTSGSAPDPATRSFLEECRGRFLRKPFAPDALLRSLESVFPDEGPEAPGLAGDPPRG